LVSEKGHTNGEISLTIQPLEKHTFSSWDGIAFNLEKGKRILQPSVIDEIEGMFTKASYEITYDPFAFTF
jgi:hypothetical protein